MDTKRADTSRRRPARTGPMRLLAGLTAGAVSLTLALVLFKTAWTSIASPATPPAAVFFRIATGSVAGTYFRIGDVIAGIISHPAGSVRCDQGSVCGPAGLIAVAQASQGSVRNVRAVHDGAVSSALAQADIVKWAYHGTDLFEDRGPLRNLRAIANLYPEAIHLVARWDAEITSITDIAGKRVSIDREGSGSYAHAHLILDALALDDSDLTLVYLDPDTAAAEIEAGTLDAMFYTAGAPVPVVAELITDGHAVLAPITGPEVETLRDRYTYLVDAVIPEGTYSRQPAIQTLGVGALWIVHADADEALIYDITRALWNVQNKSILIDGHPLGGQMDAQAATKGVPIAFHPGAERYYRQSGLAMPSDVSALTPVTSTPPQ